MQPIDIINRLKNHNGQHLPVTWARPLKTRKGVSNSVVKRTCAYVRAGINFANLGTVKQGIESGERGPVQSLPWGNWINYPYIIGHNGNDYVRLYPASFENLRPSVEYYCDGLPCTKETAQALCLASEFRTSEDSPECFTVKDQSIISVG